jgi:hypothetical protein
MGKKSPHLSEDFKTVHQEVSKLDAGACLWGHRGGHTDSSCCYRTQAHKRAEDHPQIYHRYRTRRSGLPKAPIKTLAYKTSSAKAMFPAHYVSALDPPQNGDWDVNGPNRDIKRKRFKKGTLEMTADSPVTIPEGKNFYKDTWPYWNNAHHIIPKGTLVEKINMECGKEATIAKIIKQALMVAMYNVNYQINMMFLPQDREVAEILSMPRHLTLMEADGPSGTPEATDHKGYNDTIALELKTIIDDYKSKADKVKNKEHPELKAKLHKTQLEKLSHTLYRRIVAFGSGKEKKSAGKSIAELFSQDDLEAPQ